MPRPEITIKLKIVLLRSVLSVPRADELLFKSFRRGFEDIRDFL